MDEGNKQYSDDVKVSLVIPIYNVSAYIERCLTSVFAQTYTNIECILVDDVTPDDSIVKCEKLISQYAGPITFQILHHEKNRGLSAARNTGTEAATGEYIYYLDSDDEITPECISLLVDTVNLHPDVEIVQGQVNAVPYESHYDISPFKDIDYINDNHWVRRHYYTFVNMIPINVWGKLIKMSFIKDNSLYNKEGLVHEDEQWMFFVVKVLSKIAFVHQDTYIHYGGTDGSIMSLSNVDKRAYHWSDILYDVINNLDEPEREAQILKYSSRLALYYGHNEKVSYNLLLKAYKKELLKWKHYDLYLMLSLLKVSFPLIKGKGIKWVIYNRCRTRLKSIQL